MPDYNLKKNIVFFFYLTNSVDPDEMQSRDCSIMLHFILVFTVSKSLHSGFPEYKGLINVINGFFSDHIKLLETEGRGFEPHRHHCVVVIEQDTFILA